VKGRSAVSDGRVNLPTQEAGWERSSKPGDGNTVSRTLAQVGPGGQAYADLSLKRPTRSYDVPKTDPQVGLLQCPPPFTPPRDGPLLGSSPGNRAPQSCLQTVPRHPDHDLSSGSPTALHSVVHGTQEIGLGEGAPDKKARPSQHPHTVSHPFHGANVRRQSEHSGLTSPTSTRG